MSKLSFRARALDASKPMPIYMAEELPDLPDYSAINRAVPQMPSGMEKEEECEHHLQRAICTGIIIPTPEVSDMPDREAYDKLYPANYKQPRQLIHMQPFTMEQDIPDYDMDSEDERWLMSQAQRLELNPLKFEEMMDRFEKSSGQTVVTIHEAKALLKEDDDLIIAVYDYWLNKRLKLQHPLILSVKTEHRAGIAANNPYLAFRRRTEKMQTRKNRKNDETSYEKMLKLKRDLCRAVTLLELVKRREKIKREYVHLTVEVFEKRYQARDFSGAIVAEVNTIKPSRPAFTPIFHNHYANQGWSNKAILKDEIIPRKEKRQYKKRKHKSLSHARSAGLSGVLESALSSDEEPLPQASSEADDVEEEGQFAFRRNKLCNYHMPTSTLGNWPWCSKEENGLADKRYRYTLTSLSSPKRCIGFARRRVGRGGRVILDRLTTDLDDFWRTLDFTIYEPNRTSTTTAQSSSTNNFSVVNTSNSIKTELSEFSHYDSRLRTSESETNSELVRIKQEFVDEEVDGVKPLPNLVEHAKEDEDQWDDFLSTVRRDWLHFRPKTPPPGYEPPCHMLPADDVEFNPSGSTPFSIELQALDAPSTVLDASSFVAGPFTFEDLELDVSEVPITDTRQTDDERNVQTANADPNTLTCCVNVTDEDRTIGCSEFNVFDRCANACATSKKQSTIVSSTLASPKFNSVISSAGRIQRNNDSSLSNANGLLSQFALDGSHKTKNNKIPYAYPSGVSHSNAPTSTLSLRTSAHTLTLNSHSANILEIPLSNDADKVPSKVANSQHTESSSTPPNNKNKTIVRKNNLVMEVT